MSSGGSISEIRQEIRTIDAELAEIASLPDAGTVGRQNYSGLGGSREALERRRAECVALL